MLMVCQPNLMIFVALLWRRGILYLKGFFPKLTASHLSPANLVSWHLYLAANPRTPLTFIPLVPRFQESEVCWGTQLHHQKGHKLPSPRRPIPEDYATLGHIKGSIVMLLEPLGIYHINRNMSDCMTLYIEDHLKWSWQKGIEQQNCTERKTFRMHICMRCLLYMLRQKRGIKQKCFRQYPRRRSVPRSTICGKTHWNLSSFHECREINGKFWNPLKTPAAVRCFHPDHINLNLLLPIEGVKPGISRVQWLRPVTWHNSQSVILVESLVTMDSLSAFTVK